MLTKNNFVNFLWIGMLALVCGSCVFASNSTASLKERVGQEVIQQLVELKGVTVAKVVKDERGEFVMGEDQHILTPDQVHQLQNLLLNDQNYLFDRRKRCLFIPEIALRFSGEPGVLLMVSPSCKQLMFSQGASTALLDIDPMAEELVTFCRLINNSGGVK